MRSQVGGPTSIFTANHGGDERCGSAGKAWRVDNCTGEAFLVVHDVPWDGANRHDIYFGRDSMDCRKAIISVSLFICRKHRRQQRRVLCTYSLIPLDVIPVPVKS